MIDHIKNVKISAVCCAIPNDGLEAKDFYETFGKENVDKFIKEVGIKRKFYSKNHKTITSDLCYAAAEEIFTKKGIDRSSIDALIFITQTPDYPSPATACTLQYRLGLSQECMAYDVNLACSGFVYGLHLAATKLQSGYIKRVLLLVGDVKPFNKSKRSLNEFLFGDGGCAAIIDYEEGSIGFRFALQTIGSDFKTMGATQGLRYHYVGNPKFDSNIHMDGLGVLTFTITKVPKLFNKFLETFNADINDYDAVLLHQANKTILERIAKKIGVNISKVPLSLEWYANTTSASIANAMCYHYGENSSGEQVKVIMSGFGSGLSLGVADAYIKPADMLPIIQTGITWDEGRQKVLEANAKKTLF